MKLAGLLLLVVASAGRSGAECPHEAADLLPWAADSSWDSGVPLDGADVTISRPLLLSDSTAALGTVTIAAGGRLVFEPAADDSVVQLTAALVVLDGGQLWIGAEECPFLSRADIALTGRRDEAANAPAVQKAVHVRSGVLEIHGAPKRAWTKLAATVPKTPRAELVGGAIYSAQDEAGFDRAGFAMVEFDAAGGLVRNWGVVMGTAKFDTVAAHTGNIAVVAIVAKARFRANAGPAALADAFETLCYGGGRESAIRSMVRGQRVGWVAICSIGSPELSVEQLGSEKNGRSATERLVATVGDVDFLAQSVVSPTNRRYKFADMISYAMGSVPVVETTATLVDDVSDWQEDDRIVLASTDFDGQQAEEFSLLACAECDSTTVKFVGHVQFTHWGEITDGVDMRGEVGVLTRNVRIHGVMEDACYGGNKCDKFGYDTFGGHIKMLEGFEAARIENAELYHMGQQPLLGSYPIHFHMCLDTSAKDAYVRSNSIHHTFSRCVTIHGTHNLTVQDNVAYDHLGHCFFLEDGGEQDNILTGNLGLGTRPGTLVPTDVVDEVSTFWITNPDNEITDNVAAGSAGIGLWILMPDLPIGPSANVNMGLVDQQASRTLIKAFRGNVAHSNRNFGFLLRGELKPDGTVSSLKYEPRADPTDAASEIVELALDDFVGYKNAQSVWITALYSLVTNYRVADSTIGVLLDSPRPGRLGFQRQVLADSRIVGRTANRGDAAARGWLDDDRELRSDVDGDGGADARRLGSHSAVLGVAFYRGPMHVHDTSFAGFRSNAARPAGAIGKKYQNRYFSSPVNSVQRVTFDFADPAGGARFFDGDSSVAGYSDKDGNKHSVLLDVDGSLTTYPGASIVRPLPVLVNARCVLMPSWGPGAAICPDRFTKLSVTRAGVDRTFITRNDLAAAEHDSLVGQMTISYALNTAESYIVHFNESVPAQFRLQPYGFQVGLSQVFGVCVGADTEFSVDTHTPVDSLELLKADETNSKYFYDPAVGVIMFRFSSRFPRTDNTLTECPGDLDDDGNGTCDLGPRIRLSESNEDGDCRDRAYPAYATTPVGSDGGLSVPTFA